MPVRTKERSDAACVALLFAVLPLFQWIRIGRPAPKILFRLETRRYIHSRGPSKEGVKQGVVAHLEHDE